MQAKYLVQNEFNSKRVLMIGPIKLEDSPYKVYKLTYQMLVIKQTYFYTQ